MSFCETLSVHCYTSRVLISTIMQTNFSVSNVMREGDWSHSDGFLAPAHTGLFTENPGIRRSAGQRD